MKKVRKICVITGTRAEYGLLYWLIKSIQDDPDLELQLLVTGMHLSPEFGKTYTQIVADGLPITKKVEILLSSDTPISICKATGLGFISFSEAISELQPEIVVLLGDRFEILAAASTALICRIPVAHISGGESTMGAIDEAFRHSITKMSHLHFVSTDLYRKRVIQLGESPERVFNVGAIGIDNIQNLKLLSKDELQDSLNFKFGPRNLLVTYHPVTLDNSSSETQFRQLLEALDELKDTHIIFTMPNADTDSRIIIQLIEDYVSRNHDRVAAFTSLGQLRYLSAIKYVDAVVGNSSSGIVEVPAMHKPTVNIGDRQKGRIAGNSIIECEPEKQAILSAIQFAMSEEMKLRLNLVDHPYGMGGTSEKIKQILKSYPLENILKKEFYDIEFEA